MARTREFEPEEALEKAMRLFWRKGYAETSMRDLVAHTGVAHAGLYSAFGGKRELFQAALRRYASTVITNLFHILERPDSGRAEVEAFFDGLARVARAGDFDNGCFVCNTAVEFGDKAGSIHSDVIDNLERFVCAFEGALTRAAERGEVRPDLNARASAEFLANIFVGAALLLRSKAPRINVERSVRTALEVLG